MRDLFAAIRGGDVRGTAALLNAGADPTAVGKGGFTALQLAAMASGGMDVDRSVALIRLLI